MVVMVEQEEVEGPIVLLKQGQPGCPHVFLGSPAIGRVLTSTVQLS